MQLTLHLLSTRVTSQLLAIKLAAQVSFAPCALAGARGAEAASHLAPAGPQGVGGPGDASAVRWGGLGGKNAGEPFACVSKQLHLNLGTRAATKTHRQNGEPNA